MLKLIQPPLDPQAIEPVTLHALANPLRTVQECQFVKVVILGIGAPWGPRVIAVEDWKSEREKVTAFRLLRAVETSANYDVDMNAGVVFPRRTLFPVPARTTGEDVQCVSDEVMRSNRVRVHDERLRCIYAQLNQLTRVQTSIFTPPPTNMDTRQVDRLVSELEREDTVRQEIITDWTLALLTGRRPPSHPNLVEASCSPGCNACTYGGISTTPLSAWRQA